MTKTVNAIFENGVFKPTSPLELSEHKKVTLIIKDSNEEETIDILSLASLVYNDLSPKDIEDVESLALDRSRFSRDSD
jgi:predicted DNA-binding antitoxin AbrB/MazE fold protein